MATPRTRQPRRRQEAESSRLQQAHDRLRRLEDELAATRAHAGTATNPLLVDIATALREAQELSHPLTSTPTDTDTARTPPTSRPPTGYGTPGRRAANHLHRSLRAAINNFHHAVERIDQPADPTSRGTYDTEPERLTPTVRCRTTDCPRNGKRIPWLELRPDEHGVNRAEIIWNCRECGNPYPNHPAAKGWP